MLQPIFDKQTILPGPSSQTSSIWPLVLREGDEQITSHSVGHAADSLAILATRMERTWDAVMEEVLDEYAEAWERLAAL